MYNVITRQGGTMMMSSSMLQWLLWVRMLQHLPLLSWVITDWVVFSMPQSTHYLGLTLMSYSLTTWIMHHALLHNDTLIPYNLTIYLWLFSKVEVFKLTINLKKCGNSGWLWCLNLLQLQLLLVIAVAAGTWCCQSIIISVNILYMRFQIESKNSFTCANFEIMNRLVFWM